MHNAKEFLENKDTVNRVVSYLEKDNNNLPKYFLYHNDCISSLLYEWYTGNKVSTCWNFYNKAIINANNIELDTQKNKLLFNNEYIEFLETKQLLFSTSDSRSIIAIVLKLLEYKETFTNSYLNHDLLFRFLNTVFNHFEHHNFSLNKISDSSLTIVNQYFIILNHSLDFNNNIIIEELKIEKNLCTIIIFKLFNSLYGKGITKQIKLLWLDLLDKHKELAYISFGVNNYFNNLPNNWKDKLSGLNKLIINHNLNYLFEGKTLKEQIEIYNLINELIKKEGIWIVGLLDEQFDNYNNLEELKNNLDELITSTKNKLTEIKVKPLPITKKYLTCEIIELVNGLQLLEEGKYNNHCVGGYTNRINNKRRIFSIRYQNYKFTTECIYENKTWKVVQCKGYSNKEPIEFDCNKIIDAVIKKLINELNDLYCP